MAYVNKVIESIQTANTHMKSQRRAYIQLYNKQYNFFLNGTETVIASIHCY